MIEIDEQTRDAWRVTAERLTEAGITRGARWVGIDERPRGVLHKYELALMNAQGEGALVDFWLVPEFHGMAAEGQMDPAASGMVGLMMEACTVLCYGRDRERWLDNVTGTTPDGRAFQAPELYTAQYAYWDRAEKGTTEIARMFGGDDVLHQWIKDLLAELEGKGEGS